MKRFLFRLAAILLAAAPAFASGIQYICDPSVGPGVCNTLQTTIAAQYASIFSNANALIYIQYGGIGSLSENEQYYNTVSYSTYYNALTASKADTNDGIALNSLGGGATNPVVNGDGVALTSSLDAALNISGAIGICSTATDASCNAADPACTIGTANCYNDIITVANSISLYYDTGVYSSGQYDFFTAVEHETDEALGTSSCLENGALVINPGCGNNAVGISAADLFRYSAPGIRSLLGPGGNQANGTPAYFSINGGATRIASYNNSPNGADYGDWSTICTHVQDADACNSRSGVNIANDGGVEIAVLDAVGYTLTPEPGTEVLFAAGLGTLVWIGRRRRCRMLS